MSILNPGFEEGTPNDWSNYSTGMTHKYTYPEPGRNGGSSVATEYPNIEEGKSAIWIQDTQIEPTKKYKLSGWIKTQNIVGTGASIRADWKDSTGKYLGSSNIMIHQKGTIPWTHFEGEIMPAKGAAKATICLDLFNCSGKAWFDDISFIDIIFTPAHPNMYLNKDEINVVKARLGAEPWKTAYNTFMVEANASLNTPIQSVTFGGVVPPSGNKHDYFSEPPYCGWKRVDGKDPDCRDGQINPNADRTDYESAIKMRTSVRSLGLAYALTGEKRYADKAIQLIKAWAIDPITKMTPKFTTFNGQSYIELSITMSGVFYGADLIWNYPGFGSSDKDAFKQWTQRFITSAKSWSADNNYDIWRLVFIGSAAVIVEDGSSLQYTWDRWKYDIGDQMDTQGKIIRELHRTTSLSYSMSAVSGFIIIAELLSHYGYDAYNYQTIDGKGLGLTLDFHAPYVIDPSKWPYQQIRPYIGQNAGAYELAYSWKNKDSYKNVINKWNRPMYEDRALGPVTLTHGSILK